MADQSAQIETNLQGPKQVTVDGQTVSQHSLKDQAEADEYLANKAAANQSTLPIRLAKIKPGGPL